MKELAQDNANPPNSHDSRDQMIADLERDISRLRRELAEARAETASVRSDNARAIGTLRQTLSPLFTGLKVIFGEMESIAPDSGNGQTPAAQPDNSKLAVWRSYQQKLGGKKSEFIGAMLEHGAMTAEQIRVVTHTRRSTVPQVIYELKKLGLVVKDGNKYSLKEL